MYVNVTAMKRYDYVDAFGIDLPAPDPTPPADWLGAGLSSVPPITTWVADRLGFQAGSGDPLDGWQIEASTPDTVHLVVELPVMHVDLIGHNPSATRRTLTTLLTYRRPILARLVWLVLGPAHRLTVRWLLAQSRRPMPTSPSHEPVEGPTSSPHHKAAA
jgi:hypothetical protein